MVARVTSSPVTTSRPRIASDFSLGSPSARTRQRSARVQVRCRGPTEPLRWFRLRSEATRGDRTGLSRSRSRRYGTRCICTVCLALTHDYEDLADGDLVRFVGDEALDELQPGAIGRVVGLGADGYVFIRWPDLGVQGWAVEDARSAIEIIGPDARG